MRDEDWSQASQPQSLPEGKPYHEWQSYELLPGRFLNMTLCFMGTALERKFVKMNSSGDLREPLITGTQISKEYNTGDVQKLYGVDGVRRSVAERGLLDMMIVGEPQDGPDSSHAYEIISVGDAENITIARFTPALMELVLYAEAIQGIGTNMTLSFCSFCSIVSVQLDANLAKLLNGIITQSGWAADALVTYLTVIASAVYYDYLGALVRFQNAGTVLTADVMVPGQCSKHGCRGFIAVVTLLVVHLLYVAAITALYTRKARYSRYANIWHTTSQLVTGDLREIWEKSSNVLDKAVTTKFRGGGRDDFLKLGQLDFDDQIGFLKQTPIKPKVASDLANSNRPDQMAWWKDKLRRKARNRKA
ncbi:hypothetical protein F5B21DRAFT_478136 [Xylaria acuta]|nr:hypothetical protein F5B21DRAFT_478136 [Xylaria acuta]